MAATGIMACVTNIAFASVNVADCLCHHRYPHYLCATSLANLTGSLSTSRHQYQAFILGSNQRENCRTEGRAHGSNTPESSIFATDPRLPFLNHTIPKAARDGENRNAARPHIKPLRNTIASRALSRTRSRGRSRTQPESDICA